MDFSCFKILRSYFIEVPLDRKPSKHGKDLEVVLFKGELQLNAGSATYSYGQKYTAFKKSFEAIQAKHENYKSVLVLGMGLASIPMMLEGRFEQNVKLYECVEYDEAVIALAKQYLPKNLIQKLNCHHQDARSFVQKNKQAFDLVCMDVFVEGAIPNEFLSTEFLRQLVDKLNPAGTLIFNTTNYQSSLTKQGDLIKNNFQTLGYEPIEVCPLGNRVFILKT